MSSPRQTIAYATLALNAAQVQIDSAGQAILSLESQLATATAALQSERHARMQAEQQYNDTFATVWQLVRVAGGRVEIPTRLQEDTPPSPTITVFNEPDCRVLVSGQRGSG